MRVTRYVVLFFLVFGLFGVLLFANREKKAIVPEVVVVPTATPTASISATPTPKPLTFAEMNKLYGPCVSLPILMFHHVQDLTVAKEEGHASLTVGIDYFKKDLEYLSTKGYATVSPLDLVNFFDNGVKLPSKAVMLTFDDGYGDNGTEMYQAMLSAGVKGTIFLATGLMNNPGYLSWEKVREMAGSGLITFGNHTWSHRNVGGVASVIEYEIKTANTQLADQGLNNPKIFAYPYGLESKNATKILNELGYKLAFSTKYGRTQCAQKRFDLLRIRVGNAPLSYYGL